jgi:hypothetical protein
MKNKKNRNRSRSQKRSYKTLVPYSVLESAIAGDEDAICEIVNLYENYILQLVKTNYWGTDGSICCGIDKTKADIMKIALMRDIPKFNPMY